MRFLIWMLTHTVYRVKHSELDNIPEEGPCVLVCNHVSYADALIIGGACRRPVRFVMFKPIYQLPVLNFIFRTGKAIPLIHLFHLTRHFCKVSVLGLQLVSGSTQVMSPCRPWQESSKTLK